MKRVRGVRNLPYWAIVTLPTSTNHQVFDHWHWARCWWKLNLYIIVVKLQKNKAYRTENIVAGGALACIRSSDAGELKSLGEARGFNCVTRVTVSSALGTLDLHIAHG